MRVLITGITGFVGSHLADFLIGIGQDVYGTARPRSNRSNISGILDKISLIDCNILDTVSVMKAVKEVRPEVVFHLAAQSFVPTSWSAPQDTMQTNIVGTVNILEAVREYVPGCVVMIAGTSEEYGMVYPEELPIRECNPLRPMSPYGVSKVAADLLGQQYFRSYGMKVIITRAFNHEGPRRGDVFVTGSFAKQIVEIEQGKREFLKVGNLEAIRDFSDVRDIVRAYWAVSEHGTFGNVYNICSGKGVTIAKLLDLFKEQSILPEIKVVPDSNLMRPSDVPVLVGDCSSMRGLGWSPEIFLEETIADMLEFYRAKSK